LEETVKDEESTFHLFIRESEQRRQKMNI